MSKYSHKVSESNSLIYEIFEKKTGDVVAICTVDEIEMGIEFFELIDPE